MIKLLVNHGFNRVVVLRLDSSLKLWSTSDKFSNVALVASSKRHHIDLLSIRPNNAHFRTHKRIDTLPRGNNTLWSLGHLRSFSATIMNDTIATLPCRICLALFGHRLPLRDLQRDGVIIFFFKIFGDSTEI